MSGPSTVDRLPSTAYLPATTPWPLRCSWQIRFCGARRQRLRTRRAPRSAVLGGKSSRACPAARDAHGDLGGHLRPAHALRGTSLLGQHPRQVIGGDGGARRAARAPIRTATARDARSPVDSSRMPTIVAGPVGSGARAARARYFSSRGGGSVPVSRSAGEQLVGVEPAGLRAEDVEQPLLGAPASSLVREIDRARRAPAPRRHADWPPAIRDA